MERAVGAEADPAGVCYRSQAFLHDQAFLGNSQINAPPNLFARQPIIIPVRIEAEKRQPKTILAAGCSVALTGVAACLHEHGHDIDLETDRRLESGIGN